MKFQKKKNTDNSDEISVKKSRKRSTPKKDETQIGYTPERLPRRHFRRTSSAQTSVSKKRVKASVTPAPKPQDSLEESQTLQALTLLIIDNNTPLSTDSRASDETTETTETTSQT